MNWKIINSLEIQRLNKTFNLNESSKYAMYLKFSEDYIQDTESFYLEYSSVMRNLITQDFDSLKDIELEKFKTERINDYVNFKLTSKEEKNFLYDSLILGNPYPTATYVLCSLQTEFYNLSEILVEKRKWIMHKSYVKIPKDAFVLIFDWDFAGVHLFYSDAEIQSFICD